jgi:hypothetical protein
MPKIRLTPEVGDNLSLTPPGPEDAPDTSVWSEDGAAGAQTTIVPPPTAAGAPALAWSVDEDDTVPFRSWSSAWGTATVMVALAAAVAVVIGLLGWIAFHQDGPAPVSVPSTMPAAALPPISTEPTPTTTTVTVAAQAPTPTFSGRYIAVETAPTGRTATNVWEVTPCGDGCADVAETEDGGSTRGRAVLEDGEWVFDLTLKAICGDGSSVVPYAGTGHFTISADTLRGTVRANWTKEACGLPPGVVTHNISMTRENQ